MQQEISIKLKPNEAASNDIIKSYIAAYTGKNITEITGFYKIKQSIDARSKQQVWFNLTLKVFINEPFVDREIDKRNFTDVTNSSKTVIIIGAGPAGLFAALKLIEKGIKPIVLERGKDIRSRRKDLAILNKEGIINEESNYCFGEGGAGTYSDGKLYTRSNKRGNINSILNTFVQFGADEKILVEAHPHIGTNKLPQIITAIREQILASGGNVFFEQKVTDLIIENNIAKGVTTANGNNFFANDIILATGHSARDIFTLLYKKNIVIEAKPFALGVRIEHPQQIIDSAQYHCLFRGEHLPPASYSLVEQVKGLGVFSFCMCPGGIIATASTNKNELVVNGWSPSKRNNPFANSGMVVSVDEKILHQEKIKVNKNNSPLTLMQFQQSIEEKAYIAGGGKFIAPAQRVVDFCNNKISDFLPNCSYLPGIHSVDLKNILPNFISYRLQEALKTFGKKMKGYYTNEAVLVATESRTSSPIRIPRNAETLEHIQIKNLYPCAEGAGYAGGIVSAAMDGEKIAEIIAAK